MNKGGFGRTALAVAMGLSGRYGIRVHFGAPGARTDGRNIYLPGNPYSTDPDYIRLVEGFLDHETAHIVHTDFQAEQSCKLRYPRKAVHSLANALEDVRIEHRMGKEWPGCKISLSASAEALHDQGKIRVPDDLVSAVGFMLLARLEQRVLGRDFMADVEEVAELKLLAGGVDPARIERAKSLVDQRFDADRMTTRDVVMLAQDILDEVVDPNAPQSDGDEGNQSGDSGQQQDQDSNGDKSESKPDGDKEDASGAAGDGDDAADSENRDKDEDDGHGSDEQGNDRDGSGSEAGDGEEDGQNGDENRGGDGGNAKSDSGNRGQDESQGSGGISMEDLENVAEQGESALAEALNEAAGKTTDSEYGDCTAANNGMGLGVWDENLIIISPGDRVQPVPGVARILAGRLQALLEAKTERHWNRRKFVGKVDERNVHRLLTKGELTVFRRRERQSTDGRTAVLVLADCSGSMEGRMEIQKQSVMAMTDALATMQDVEVAVYGYDHRMFRFKDFGTPLMEARRTIARMRAHGYTRLEEAMIASWAKLMQREADRRILLVTTDGQVGGGACRLAESMHIPGEFEVLGLGMGVDISHALPISRSIMDIGQLPGAMVSLLQDRLVGMVA